MCCYSSIIVYLLLGHPVYTLPGDKMPDICTPLKHTHHYHHHHHHHSGLQGTLNPLVRGDVWNGKTSFNFFPVKALIKTPKQFVIQMGCLCMETDMTSLIDLCKNVVKIATCWPDVVSCIVEASLIITGVWGSVVVKALRYKSDGPGIDSRWCHWICQWCPSFRWNRGPGIDSAPSENEYQGERRPVRKADNLPPYCAVVTKYGTFNFSEPSGPHRACYGTALPLPYY